MDDLTLAMRGGAGGLPTCAPRKGDMAMKPSTKQLQVGDRVLYRGKGASYGAPEAGVALFERWDRHGWAVVVGIDGASAGKRMRLSHPRRADGKEVA